MADLVQLPSTVNLTFVAGDTFRIRLRVLNPADGSENDLTEYRFLAEIVGSQARAHVGHFEVTPDPASPTSAVILHLPPADTEKLPVASDGGDGNRFTGFWDLEVTFPNGDVRTVATGTVTCNTDISRRDMHPEEP